MAFPERIIAWQRRHGRRGLPWQGTRDPYRIWLSEVMLQQTQVAAVIPYYQRFLYEYPTVEALAAAQEDDVLRLWSAVDIPMLSRMKPWQARLRFALRPIMIIDLLAVLPFYLQFLIPIDLRVLRVLRLFRLLKLVRYSPALQSLGRVLADEYRALLGALLVMLVLLLFTFVMLMNELFFVAQKAVAHGLGWGASGRLILYELPRLVVMTIPMGTLLGTLVAVGRLSADHEWVGMQSAGLGPFALLRPVSPPGPS